MHTKPYDPRIRETRRYRVGMACCILLFQAVVLAGITNAAAQPAPSMIDRLRSDSGRIIVSAVRQMSVVIETPRGVLYTDPTGGKHRYADFPPPDVILISHEHHEHYDAGTLEKLVRQDTRLIVPPYVMERLPERLRSRAVSLANGQSSDLGAIRVGAVAAYGTIREAERWHPRGRGNGYVVTVDGRRLYVAGSTQVTPEMLSLEDIYLAFLPLYPPYALGPEDAVQAVSIVRPEFAYIYQYDSQATRDAFLRIIDGNGIDATIIAPDIGQ